MSGEVGYRRLAPQGMRWERGKGSTDERILEHEELDYEGGGGDHEDDNDWGGWLQVVKMVGSRW